MAEQRFKPRVVPIQPTSYAQQQACDRLDEELEHIHEPISNKVAYVKSQSQTRNHTCHWIGCNRQVPPALWGCRQHWYMLPKHLRDKIWATYEIGQEATMSPSDEYLEVADEVQRWIQEHS